MAIARVNKPLTLTARSVVREKVGYARKRMVFSNTVNSRKKYTLRHAVRREQRRPGGISNTSTAVALISNRAGCQIGRMASLSRVSDGGS